MDVFSGQLALQYIDTIYHMQDYNYNPAKKQEFQLFKTRIFYHFYVLVNFGCSGFFPLISDTVTEVGESGHR